MSKQDVCMIVCRTLSVVILYRALMMIDLVAAGAMQMHKDYGEASNDGESIAVFAASFIPFALLTGGAIWLWIRAPRAADLMTRGMTRPDDLLKVSATTVQAIAYATLGVWVLANALPLAAHMLVTIYWLSDGIAANSLRWQSQAFRVVTSCAAVLVQLAIGLVLVLYAGRLARLTLADDGDGPNDAGGKADGPA